MIHSLFKYIAILPIKLYQIFVSNLFTPSCRFTPSCSYYSMQAIIRHGVIMGIWLTIKRVLRCNPINHNKGYDPVP